MEKSHSILKKSYSINIIFIFLLFILSFGIFSFYPQIKDLGKDNTKSVYENYSLLNNINKSCYVLYKDALEIHMNTELTYEEVYLKSIDSDNYEYERNNFNKELEQWEIYLKENLKNLDYAVIDKDGNNVESNRENNLETLINNGYNEELINNYDYYMVVNFDENGRVSVSNVYGANEYNIRNIFSEFSMRRKFNHLLNDSNIKLNSIENSTFIYGIPKELAYSDDISDIINSPENNASWSVIVAFVAILFGVIFLVSLLIPFKIGSKVFGIKRFFRIPFEINCFIFLLGASLISLGDCSAILQTLEGKLGKGIIVFGLNKQIDLFLGFSINMGLWILTIYLIFAGVMIIKYIFRTGLIEYLKENLLIVNIYRVLKKFY